ncbi:/ / hypothetical protein / 586887:588569 Forward [Candidatus Hepatoplasma crinochetorum]|uniref:KAP NTPase domain-containing protein n=1 Tax=Candidatus Hepatoplasma crinochetorum TaxID=295596 RepID=A0A0G7ZLQ7_9MOLU|nr:/ / hypothetical protein / 586887:588569 Forward [Candidatus Hepatoplasma crinochetorum]
MEKESENFIINKGYSIELIVKEDDFELIEVSKKFIKYIEIEYKKYKKKLKEEEERFKKYLDKKNAYFSQEKLLKKSPLTILNAPWGSGKTFFIESFTKHFIDNKIIASKFKKIIILDAWKYSNSKNIPDEIMSELFYILSEKNTKNELKEKFIKLSINLFNATALSWINKFGYMNFENIKKNIKEKKKGDIENLFINISKEIKPTLVIFDNIERIGKYSWEIMKAIFKISQIDNLCFILPMNINKLNDNKKSNEYPIEKYVDLPIFEFKQDYLSFLQNNKVKNEEAILINNILNTEIDGKKLSIREVEQRFNANNILNDENYFSKMNKIINKIWESKIHVKKQFLNNENIENLLFYLKSLLNNFNEFKKTVLVIKNLYLNIDKELDYLIKFIQEKNWDFFIDYSDWIKKYNEIINKIKECDKNINIEFKNQNKNVNEIEDIKSKKEENIIQLKEKINREDEKGLSKDNHKKTLYLNEIEMEKKDLNEIYIKIKNINIEKKKIQNIKEKNKSYNLLLINKKIEYENILKELNENIDTFLKKKYINWKEKINFTYNNSNFWKEKFINELLI